MKSWTAALVAALFVLLGAGIWLYRDRERLAADFGRLSGEAQRLGQETQRLSGEVANSATEIARLKSAIETARQDAQSKARAEIDNLNRQIGDLKAQLTASEKKAGDLADRLAAAEGKARVAEVGRVDAERSAADDLRMAREVERRRAVQKMEHERTLAQEKAALERQIEEARAARLAAKRLAQEKDALERQIEQAKAARSDTTRLTQEKAALERRIEEAKTAEPNPERLAREKTALEQRLAEAKGRQDVEVAQREGRIEITVASRILFESGSDRLRTEGMEVLHTLAQSAANDDREIHVVGHTDDLPIRRQYRDRFATNWDLAAARATAAARYLIEACKIAAGRVVVHSHGATRPIAPNETEDGRAKNRRIEILFVPAGTTKR